MPQSGSDRKRKWKANKRLEGWTNSEIQSSGCVRLLLHRSGFRTDAPPPRPALSDKSACSSSSSSSSEDSESGKKKRRSGFRGYASGSHGGLSSSGCVLHSSGSNRSLSGLSAGGRGGAGSFRRGHRSGKTRTRMRKFLFGSASPDTLLDTCHANIVEAFGQVLEDWGVEDKDIELLPEMGGFIDPSRTRIYSALDRNYGTRGGEPYFKPKQWRRFSVRVPDFNERCKTWAVAFHGTERSIVKPILVEGFRTPTERNAPSAHGQAFAGEKKGEVIYLSPCLGYASHPVYSQLFELDEGHFAQIVFQCRVDPARIWKRCPSSFSSAHWPKDVRFAPEFPTHENMEWLVLDPSAVVVYGILFREFGPRADANVYGEVVRKVMPTAQSPEFEWTEHLEAEYRRLGHLVTPVESDRRTQ